MMNVFDENRRRLLFFRIKPSSSFKGRAVCINSIENATVLDSDNERPLEAVAGPDGGTLWTDVLRCGGSDVPLILSEAFCEEMKAAGLTGMQFHRMSFKLKGKVGKPPGRYYALLPDGPGPRKLFRFFKEMPDGRYDFVGESLEGGKTPEARAKFYAEGIISVHVPILSTWSGRDVMGVPEADPESVGDKRLGFMCEMVCSRRFLEFLRKKKTPGIRVVLFNTTCYHESENIPWPPEVWLDREMQNLLDLGNYFRE